MLKYGPDPVAAATMGYNHRTLALASILTSLSALNFLLKIIPNADGSPRICDARPLFHGGHHRERRLGGYGGVPSQRRERPLVIVSHG